MLSEILAGYGVFILELITLIIVLVAIVGMLMLLKSRKNQDGELQVIDLSEKYKNTMEELRSSFLSDDERKESEKAKKKADKLKAKEEKAKRKRGEIKKDPKPYVYVLDFQGDMMASQTDGLKEEVNAILEVANPELDEVLLRLESPGGVVHGYGLAASQLSRLKQKGIKLTIAVDKVAASGGYMMACVAHKIVSAPFAVIGSIGVVAQVPNIHRLLKKHDIDVDVMTAGEFKRTVTLLGENTEKGKEKFQQELEETHLLFKHFVEQNRPQLNLDQVATGEHWFGQQALSLQLVDEIATSDDLLLQAIKEKSVVQIKYLQKQTLTQKLGKQVETSLDRILLNWLKRNERTII